MPDAPWINAGAAYGLDAMPLAMLPQNPGAAAGALVMAGPCMPRVVGGVRAGIAPPIALIAVRCGEKWCEANEADEVDACVDAASL
jgi:hypothetical protein